MNFHEEIAEASTNPVFAALVAVIHNLMRIIQESFPDSPEARKDSLEYHKRIFHAIKDKDPGQAEAAM